MRKTIPAQENAGLAADDFFKIFQPLMNANIFFYRVHSRFYPPILTIWPRSTTILLFFLAEHADDFFEILHFL